jgi:hypothetical protein
MMTENIDLKVGVANGTTGIVTKLEFDIENNVYRYLKNSFELLFAYDCFKV